jgi:hypothetical protein
MNEEGKRRIWPWIAAGLIGFPVLYVLSFGPACWLCANGKITGLATARLYRPLIMTEVRPVAHCVSWYNGLLNGRESATVEWMRTELWFFDKYEDHGGPK